MFEHFWDTIETIPEGLGYKLISVAHFTELVISAIFVVVCCVIYRKADTKKREKIRKWFIILLWADEAFKHIGLIMNGNWLPDYLPLHLCSINILICTIHYLKNSNFIGNFLWTICVPAACLALAITTWSSLPILNFMHLHSLSIHMLLLAYPIMLVSGGDIKKDYHYILKIVLMLACLALPIFGINKLLGTNFMFVNYTDNIALLELFEKLFGWHVIGILILLPIVIGLMYLPYRKIQSSI